MGEFFRGWRRKVGVVTLVMACVLMAWWVRSLTNTDVVGMTTGSYRHEIFYSINGSLIWMHVNHDQLGAPLPYPALDWSIRPNVDYDIFTDPQMRWHVNAKVFGVGKDLRDGSTYTIVRYGSIVGPMTLLSAYLLLIKPRSSTQKKLTEPITNEGT